MFFAEDRAVAFFVRQIATDFLSAFRPSRLQLLLGHFVDGAAEPTGIEQNDLHAFALGSVNLGVVNPAALPQRGILRRFEKLHESVLGCLLALELLARIVLAVIVVIPCADDRTGLAQRGESRNGRKLFVAVAQLHRVRRVGINIVAGENEKLGLQSVDGLPDRLRTALVGAGAEGDAGEGFLRGGTGHSSSEEGGAKDVTHVHHDLQLTHRPRVTKRNPRPPALPNITSAINKQTCKIPSSNRPLAV